MEDLARHLRRALERAAQAEEAGGPVSNHVPRVQVEVLGVLPKKTLLSAISDPDKPPTGETHIIAQHNRRVIRAAHAPARARAGHHMHPPLDEAQVPESFPEGRGDLVQPGPAAVVGAEGAEPVLPLRIRTRSLRLAVPVRVETEQLGVHLLDGAAKGDVTVGGDLDDPFEVAELEGDFSGGGCGESLQCGGGLLAGVHGKGVGRTYTHGEEAEGESGEFHAD